MRNLIPFAFGLALLTACGGTGDQPPTDEPPVEEPDAPDAGLPAMDCPEGGVYQTGQGAQGVEQYCERNGVMHGPIRKYYANGNRAAEGRYDGGDPDGTWSWWYEDGAKKSKGTYKKGKQTGSWSWWHQNGNRQTEGDFLRGRKAGQWTSWFESGRTSEEGLYHNDEKNGVWKYFLDDEEGTVQRTETWKGGSLAESIEGAPPKGGQ